MRGHDHFGVRPSYPQQDQRLYPMPSRRLTDRVSTLHIFGMLTLLLAVHPAWAQKAELSTQDKVTGKNSIVKAQSKSTQATSKKTVPSTQSAQTQDQRSSQLSTFKDKSKKPENIQSPDRRPKRTVGQEKRLPSDRVPIRQRAITRSGSTGLNGVISADPGPQGTIRFGIQVSGFSSEKFLTVGVKERFSRGDLAVSYTPIDLVEIFASTRSLSYSNPLSSPQYIQGQGDFSLGTKVGHFWGVIGGGAALSAHFIADPSGGGWLGAATNYEFRALLTTDLTRRTTPLPFRFLVDIQFTKENTEHLFQDLVDEPSLIQEWGYQAARYDRLMLNFGMEVPTTYVSPFVEYHIGTPFLVEMPRMGQYSRVFAFDSVPHYAAGGIRAFPRPEVSLEFGATIGMSDAPFTGVPATPPWSIWGGVSYTLDPRPEVIEREIKIEPPPPPKIEPKPQGTLLNLIILDAVDQKPIQEAVIRFKDTDLSPQLSDEQGRFIGYRLAPKKYVVEVTAEGYISKKVRIGIKKEQVERKAKLKLKRDPKKGTAVFEVSIKLSDQERLKNPRLEMTLIGPESHKMALTTSTSFKKELLSGEYVLIVSDANDRTYYEVITLGSNGEGRREISLNMLKSEGESGTESEKALDKAQKKILKGSTKWLKFNLKRKRLATKRAITFNGEGTSLTRTSKKIVKGLAEFLKTESRIQKIVIMVHTHSRGDAKADKRLGYRRGQVIKKLLKKEGIDGNRVAVFSFGSDKNIGSNLSRRGRQRNQRVFMRIKSVDL